MALVFLPVQTVFGLWRDRVIARRPKLRHRITQFRPVDWDRGVLAVGCPRRLVEGMANGSNGDLLRSCINELFPGAALTIAVPSEDY